MRGLPPIQTGHIPDRWHLGALGGFGGEGFVAHAAFGDVDAG